MWVLIDKKIQYLQRPKTHCNVDNEQVLIFIFYFRKRLSRNKTFFWCMAWDKEFGQKDSEGNLN